MFYYSNIVLIKERKNLCLRKDFYIYFIFKKVKFILKSEIITRCKYILHKIQFFNKFIHN